MAEYSREGHQASAVGQGLLARLERQVAARRIVEPAVDPTLLLQRVGLCEEGVEVQVPDLPPWLQGTSVSPAWLQAPLTHESVVHGLPSLHSFEAVPEVQRKRRGIERGLRVSFKQVNDACGHLVVDVVLRQVAAALQSACRTADEEARVGGDEFLVLLHNDDPDVAAAIAERMRGQVAEVCVDVDGPVLKISISVGGAGTEVREIDVSALLERCHAALSGSIKRGRNCVTLTLDP